MQITTKYVYINNTQADWGKCSEIEMHHTLECVIGSARWVGGYLVIFKLGELNITQAKTVGGGMTPNRKMSR